MVKPVASRKGKTGETDLPKGKDFHIMAKIQKKTKSQPTTVIKTQATRPPIIPERIYNRSEAALAVGCSYVHVVRAKNSGKLGCYVQGRRVLHSGEHLLSWLKLSEIPAREEKANA
jgi:ribosomal protein S19